MSRYVKKKHGLIIGSDNCFFYWDKDRNMHDFPCILGVQGFQFENSVAYSFRIRTPAQQLLVHFRRLKKGEYIDEFGRDCDEGITLESLYESWEINPQMMVDIISEKGVSLYDEPRRNTLRPVVIT